MQTFSSHHIPCPPTADVTHLILYTRSSHCTTFFLYCQCDPPGTAHFLYSYCRCDIPDTTDFLLTPRALFSHCRCSPSDTAHSLLTLHNFLIVLQMQPSWYCTLSPYTADVTFLILQIFSACTIHPLFLLGSDPLHTVHLLLILNTLS